MPRRPSAKQAALSLVKRTQAAGIKVSRFEFEPTTGRVVIHLSDEGAAALATPLDAWRRARGAR